MEQGEIWYVHFIESESIGHEYQKNRPVLIVQSDKKLKISNVISIVPFSSHIDSKHSDDIIIKKDNDNGLLYDSVLKVHHIQSFDKNRFIKKIGIINQEIKEQIKSYLRKHFDI